MPDSTNDVAWASLPNKDQLFILVVARFSEPVVRTSILTYIFYQLQSIDASKSASEVIREAAILQTVFTLMQGITALLWGYVADSPRGGRKIVLLIGLSGSLVSTVAFGFIRDFRQAVFIRVIEGALNGNTAIIRTMVSEVVEERRFQTKAFVLMPMCYNVASIVSPMMAGLLANLAGSYPQTFGENPFLRRFPYAPPAIASGFIVLFALLLVFFFLRETQAMARHKYDLGLDLAARIASLFTNRGKSYNNQHYNVISPAEVNEEMIELVDDHEEGKEEDLHKEATKPTLPLRRIFTRNLCLTVISYAIQEGHIAAYNTLWPSFLSNPVAIPGKDGVRLPFHFSGGAGMPVKHVAISLALVGVLGIPLQILGYSEVVKRLGLLRTWRIFLVGFPLVYFFIPYILIVPSTSSPPAARDGPFVWLMIFVAQALIMVSSTWAIPCQMILTNNSSPHPTALGRTHSLTVMLASLTRTISPALGGLVLSYWSAHGVTGMAWWMMSVTAVTGCIFSMFVYEGNGHEIWLEGDEE